MVQYVNGLVISIISLSLGNVTQANIITIETSIVDKAKVPALQPSMLTKTRIEIDHSSGSLSRR